MNTQQAILGTLIAVLRRKFPPILTIEQIREGLKIAKQLNIEDNIIHQGEGRKGFVTDQKDVTSAGTAVQLPSIAVREGTKPTMIAKPGNTGVIYFGNSKGECESSSKRFDGLNPGLAHSFPVNNTDEIWIDAGTSGEGVSIYVEQ